LNSPFQKAAFLAKSLSDGNRLRILLLISGGKKSVSAIVEALDLSQPLVSRHKQSDILRLAQGVSLKEAIHLFVPITVCGMQRARPAARYLRLP
jgi:hypothetical protein